MNDGYYQRIINTFKSLPFVLQMAFTIYGEARGESQEAKIEVGWVIHVRSQDNQSWNDVDAPFQFSCWNYGDPNLIKIVNALLFFDKVLQECLDIAYGIELGNIKPAFKATHYHDTSVFPSWAVKMEFKGQIGKLKFYEEKTA